MVINHNLLANNAIKSMNSNSANASKSMTKLSSGLRINSAADDAAGLAISEKMRGQIRGLDQASNNAQDAISLTQTAEGALNETQSILQRMRELSVQASNDTNTSGDRGEIQKEMNQLTSEVNRIGNTTEFNTMKLLNGDRANTAAVDGVKFDGGTKTAAANATGIDVTLTTANALTDGAHKLDITSTRETRADQVIAPLAPGTAATGSAATSKFANDSITVSGGTVTDSSTITLTWDSANQGYKITGTLADAVSTTFGAEELVKVGVEYNNHGLKFTLDSAGSVHDGATLTFKVTDSAASTTIGTKQVGYTTVDTNSAVHATFAGSGVTLKDSQELSALASGQVRITITSASIQVELLNASGTVVENDTMQSGKLNYNEHGVSFNITGATGAGNTDVITLDISKDTYKIQASLDSGTAVTIASGYDGTSTTGSLNGSGTIGGMTFAQNGALKSGSYSFNSVADKTGEDKSLTMQVGANQGQAFTMDISDMRSQALGISASGTGIAIKNSDGSVVSGAAWTSTQDVTNGTDNVSAEYSLDVSNATKATAAIKVLDNAITKISSERSKLGAYQNRLEHTINNLGTSSENLTSAESRIRDVDMAKEMSTYSKNNILSQAAQAMLAQANQAPQQVLSLLR